MPNTCGKTFSTISSSVKSNIFFMLRNTGSIICSDFSSDFNSAIYSATILSFAKKKALDLIVPKFLLYSVG